MTEAERQSIVRELERLGWIYDSNTDRFHDAARELEWKDAIALVPTLAPKDTADNASGSSSRREN